MRQEAQTARAAVFKTGGRRFESYLACGGPLHETWAPSEDISYFCFASAAQQKIISAGGAKIVFTTLRLCWAEARSSFGRALVSKTKGRRFDPYLACPMISFEIRRGCRRACVPGRASDALARNCAPRQARGAVPKAPRAAPIWGSPKVSHVGQAPK